MGDIVLNSETPPKRFSVDRVYLAFPSGAFTYDCVTCGAQCCRGHGYEINAAEELKHQLESQAVHFFIDPCEAHQDHYHVRNAAPGCFFLTDSNLCRLQLDKGFGAKPGTCRLFPFNGMFRVGNYLVIHPHGSLCPLQIARDGVIGEASAHDTILRQLTSQGVDQHVEIYLPISDNVAALVALERQIVELSATFMARSDYAAFAAAQLDATFRFFPDSIARDTSGQHPAADQALANLDRDIQHALGVAGAEADDPSVAQTMAAMTSAVRAHLVFRRSLDSAPTVSLALVPGMLVALHRMAQLAKRTGMPGVSYQTVMRIFADCRPLLTILCQLHSVVAWKTDAVVDLAAPGPTVFRKSYAHIARLLLPNVQQREQKPLFEILRSHLPPSGFARVQFLKRVSRRIAGQVTALQHRSFVNRLMRAPKATVQHLVLGAMDADRIAAIAGAIAPGRAKHSKHV